MDDFLSLYEEAENYDKTNSPLCDQLSRTIDVYTDEREIAKGGMKTITQVFCNSTHR